MKSIFLGLLLTLCCTHAHAFTFAEKDKACRKYSEYVWQAYQNACKGISAEDTTKIITKRAKKEKAGPYLTNATIIDTTVGAGYQLFLNLGNTPDTKENKQKALSGIYKGCIASFDETD